MKLINFRNIIELEFIIKQTGGILETSLGTMKFGYIYEELDDLMTGQLIDGLTLLTHSLFS